MGTGSNFPRTGCNSEDGLPENSCLSPLFAHGDTPTPALRKFGLLIGALLIVLGSFRLWRHHAGAEIFLTVGGLLLLVGLLYPRLLRPLYALWMTLATVMGLVMTRVVLTLVFIFVVTPLALLNRLTGKDPLALRKQRAGQGSYWRLREAPGSTREEYERQY